MALSGIPVEIYGVTIGTATISDEGSVELVMSSPSKLGKDLMQRLEAGQYSRLSLIPRLTPLSEREGFRQGGEGNTLSHPD